MTTRTALSGSETTMTAEPDYNQMSTLELIDALEYVTSTNPGVPEGLIWEVVARLARAEQTSAA